MKEILEQLEDDMQHTLASRSQQQQQRHDSAVATSSLAPTIRTLPGRTQQADPSWFVTLQHTHSGIQLETSISRMVDLIQFIRQGAGFSPQRPPTYYSNHAQQTMMVVTNKMLKVELALRKVFGKQALRQEDTITINISNPLYSYDHTRQMTILHLVDSHFQCVRSVVPIVASYYHPLISRQPESTVAYAMAGFMALSSCALHVNDKRIPYDSRSDFGKYLYDRAKDKLRDDLFDNDTSSIETVLAMLIMIRSSMILVRNKDTRLYLDLAWRTVLALRDTHLPTLRTFPFETTTPALAQAETWRRLFYGVRYMLIHVQIILDDPVDFGSLILESNIGYPQPLPCECVDPQEKRRVEIYSLSVRFDDCHISSNNDTIGYRLFAGVLDQASLWQLSYMEHRLFSYWQGLPAEYRLSPTPMEYLDPAVVVLCADPHILRISQLYYAHWLTLQTRFMQPPATANLKDTSLTRIDGGRALLIVSICGDAMTHLFQAFYTHHTCMLELHWLLIVTDALQLLTKTANDAVRTRAERNLKACLPILMAQMQAKHDAPPPSYGGALSPVSSASSSPAASYAALSPGDSASSEGLDEIDNVSHQDPSLVYYGKVKKMAPSFLDSSLENHPRIV
jgi:hypothetical protein